MSISINNYVEFRVDGDQLYVTVMGRDYLVYDADINHEYTVPEYFAPYGRVYPTGVSGKLTLKLTEVPKRKPRWSKPKRRRRTALGLRRPVDGVTLTPKGSGWVTLGYTTGAPYLTNKRLDLP